MLRVGEDPVHEMGRFVRRETALLVHPGKDFALLIGRVTDLRPFEGELVFEEFALRSNRDVLADGHGEGAGEQAGHARENNHPGRRVCAGDAHHQGQVAYQPVIRSEDNRAKHGVCLRLVR